MRGSVEWVALGVVAGEALAPRGLPVWALVVCGVGCAMAARWRGRRCSAVVGGLIAAAGGAAVGWLLVAATVGRTPTEHDVARVGLPLEGELVGCILTVPVSRADRTVVVVGAESFDDGRRRVSVGGRVRLTIRGGVRDLRRGERIGVRTTVRRPRNFENPGGFDFVGHLARRGVHATASVWDSARITRLAPPAGGLVPAIDAWRERVARALGEVERPDVRAVLAALVLGDESAVDDELRRAFTRAGVVHVLSVSGLHVGIVAGAATIALAWLLGRSERLLLSIDVRRTAMAASVVPVVLYGALAGFEIATLRSVVMTSAVVVAALLGRRAQPLRALALAAIVVCVGWPGAPREIAFQLSFASVLALVLSAIRPPSDSVPARPGRCRVLRAALTTSAAAWAATAPLTALHFHQLSTVAIVANPLVIPLFGGIVLVPALLGALVASVASDAAVLLLRAAAIPAGIGVDVVTWIGNAAWAAVATPIPTVLEVALCYALLLGVCLRRYPPAGVILLGAASLAVVDAGWWMWQRAAPGVLRVTFLDVGQGDGTVVEFADGRVLVVDGGGFPGSDFDTGAAILEPFLRTRKIGRIDAIAMTHAHPDHAGGLAHLLRSFSVGELWWNGEAGQGGSWSALTEAVAASGVPSRVRFAGDDVPGFRDVEVLHPPAAWPAPSLNDGSLVLRIHHHGASLLLTGDIEAAAEDRLVRDATPTDALVIKVPHHGSATSSGELFVEAVRPRFAVVSVGQDNRYRHPAPEVEARYRRIGARVLRTDRCGAVTVTTDGRGVWVTTARPACDGAML